MKPARLTKVTLATGLTLASAVPWLLASCATTDATSPSSPDASTLLDAGRGPDAPDAGDAGEDECDESDENCVTTPVACEDADWCPVATNVSRFYALTSVWGSGKNDVWATGSGGTVIHWDGVEWKPTVVPSETPLPVRDTFRALWGSGPNDVWIASATDRIYHSDGFANGDATWVLTPSATLSDHDRRPLFAAWGTSASDVRFGGGSSGVFDPEIMEVILMNQVVRKPAAGAIEWDRAKGSATVYGLWGSSADDLWLIGDNRPFGPQVATTLHGTRGSGGDFVWTAVDSAATVILRGVWGSSASDVWTVGGSGTIRHFGKDATAWAVVEAPTTANLNAVWGSGPNDVWVVGDHGTILHWDGKAWTESVAALPLRQRKPHLYGIWGSGPDDVWIVGNDIALHHGPNAAGGTK
ncbi:MAG: hypothetical protein KF850_27485 [Labilithrix sp.]|nr:hypothetical protein [Labilithrix sp.]